MTTSRIEPVSPERAPRWVRVVYRIARRRYGAVPEPFAVSAHHPGLLLSGAIHETALERASRKLPANVRELAVFWTARTIGCSWCVDFGAMLQRLDGLDTDRLKDIDNYASSPHYSDDERGAFGEVGELQFTGIALDAEDTRVLLEFPVQLIGVDVNREDFGGAVLQKAVGEAAIGGAEVEANRSCWVH